MKSNIFSKRILSIIFITIVIDMIGIGILIPIFPMLLSPQSLFKITPLAWSSRQNYILAGWLIAVYPLAQFFCSPILGQLSDHYGRRKILIYSISGTCLAYLLFAIAIVSKNLPLMFCARILDGASGGNISTSQAVIADISEAPQRARNFGLVGVAIGIGFVLGPVIGGKLSDSQLLTWFNAATPFWFAGALSVLNLLFIVGLLPETLPEASSKPLSLTKPLQNIRRIFSFTKLKVIIFTLFLFNSGFTFFTTFWGIILAEKYAFTATQIGNFFAYMGVMIILAQGMVVRRMSGRVNDYQVLYYSLFITAACLLAYSFIPKQHPGWIYFFPPIMAVSIALSKAFGLALITRVSPEAVRGEVMGMNSSSNALAQALPAMLSGYLAAAQTTLAILVGALVVIASGLFFCLSYNQRLEASQQL